MYGRWRAGRRRRPLPKPQASARGPFGSGLIDIAVKGWQACKTHHRGPIGCAGRHPRWWPKRSSGGVGKLEKQIAAATGVSPATVSRVLRRLGLNKLSALEPAEPIRRYEREHPGELIHLDIKKLGRIGSVGHRITGRYPGAQSTVTTASVGSSFMSALMIPRGSRSCRSWSISARRVRLPSWRSLIQESKSACSSSDDTPYCGRLHGRTR